eukprot:SAG31_NODE_39381_length_288_cov_1.634921_1_plen_35_part_10
MAYNFERKVKYFIFTYKVNGIPYLPAWLIFLYIFS